MQRAKALLGQGTALVINGDAADFLPAAKFRHTESESVKNLKNETVLVWDDCLNPQGQEFRQV